MSEQLENVRVCDIMSKRLVVIECDKNAFEIAKTMAEKKISSVLLVDSGKLGGILTKRDLARQVCAKDMAPSKMPATAVMSAPVITVDKDTTLKQTEEMVKNGIRHQGIQEGKSIVGILRATDIARYLGRGVATSTILRRNPSVRGVH